MLSKKGKYATSRSFSKQTNKIQVRSHRTWAIKRNLLTGRRAAKNVLIPSGYSHGLDSSSRVEEETCSLLSMWFLLFLRDSCFCPVVPCTLPTLWVEVPRCQAVNLHKGYVRWSCSAGWEERWTVWWMVKGDDKCWFLTSKSGKNESGMISTLLRLLRSLGHCIPCQLELIIPHFPWQTLSIFHSDWEC